VPFSFTVEATHRNGAILAATKALGCDFDPIWTEITKINDELITDRRGFVEISNYGNPLVSVATIKGGHINGQRANASRGDI
jgi:hypothetical protein